MEIFTKGNYGNIVYNLGINIYKKEKIKVWESEE